MPPALSDYDSTSESESEPRPLPTALVATKDNQEKSAVTRIPPKARCQGKSPSEPKRVTATVRTERQSVPSTASKKRKCSNLLAGLELNNIITTTDEEEQSVATNTPLTSTAPTSSLRTRGQTNKMHFSKPVYDQKYHPMDDVIQPSRAAQHRVRYEERYPDDDSEGTDFCQDEQSDSDVEADHQPSPNKRRKFSTVPPASAQGTRRSSRHVNRNVLYNTSIHPQDEDIDHMEVDSEHEDTSSEDESDPSQLPESDPIAVGGRVTEFTINDTASESSSSPPRSSPLSSIALGPLPPTHPRLVGGPVQAHRGAIHVCSPPTRRKSPAFRIYEDTLEDELAREASNPVPTVEHAHDDKENPAEGTESEDLEVALEDITVQTVEEFDEARINAVHDTALDYTELRMFDSSTNEMDYDHHIAPFHAVVQLEASNIEHDSVLGTSSPPRRLDRVVLGKLGSNSPIGHSIRQNTPEGGWALFR